MADLRLDTERVRTMGAGLSRIAAEFENANVVGGDLASKGLTNVTDIARSVTR